MKHVKREKRFIAGLILLAGLVWSLASIAHGAPESWMIDSSEEWLDSKEEISGLRLSRGAARPLVAKSKFSSVLKSYPQKIKASQIVFQETPVWNNWNPIPAVGPKGTKNAPIFLPIADGDYWYFANLIKGGGRGYHAFHSSDMKSWKDYGEVTDRHWYTTAEYADGKFYLYDDHPNDEEPHLIIFDSVEDLKNGKKRDLGMVFNDPSHGSDMAIFRDSDGTFHIIYEDWTPIDARKHSWDSSLAGHADSPDGINGFEPHENPPPIDERTGPTGKISTYMPNRNQMLPGQKPYPYEFEVQKGQQEAFGDYTMIKVGQEYYIFCDYDARHKSGKSMRVGRWRSDDINKQFVWDGEIGENFHPDPTIGFAEGKFYLLVQRNENDFVSPGPWVDTVKARVGVDTNNNKKIDHWSDWKSVSESYALKPGFARVVDATPAALDLSSLPAGYGFKFEFTTHLTSASGTQPILDSIAISFD